MGEKQTKKEKKKKDSQKEKKKRSESRVLECGRSSLRRQRLMNIILYILITAHGALTAEQAKRDLHRTRVSRLIESD